jgi:hypothetical protein
LSHIGKREVFSALVLIVVVVVVVVGGAVNQPVCPALSRTD